MKKYWYFFENDLGSVIASVTVEESRNFEVLGKKWSSKSCWYKTKKDLITGCEILDKPCIKCGRIIGSNYSNKKELVKLNVCFNCWFWIDKLPIKDKDTTVRVDGSHYIIHPDSPGSYFKGFGGRGFNIEFFDGREVITHNLWHQGTIPEWFRDELPDNAKFVKP